MSKINELKPWLKTLAGIAVVLIGGVMILIILIEGFGVRLTDAQGGALGLLWCIVVGFWLYDRMREGRL